MKFTLHLYRRILTTLGIGFCVLTINSACSSPPKFVKVPQLTPAPAAASGNALVIFLRPSGYPALGPSPLFDVTDETRVLAVPDPHTKTGILLPAGIHRFMVIMENVDFIDADLLPGKTYYILISPRVGFSLPHFRLIAFKRHPSEPAYAVGGSQLKTWLDACTPIGNAPGFDAFWGPKQMKKLNERKDEGLAKWAKAEASVKQVHYLAPEDGE
ncbi:MAG: hypothetical protein IPP19_13500 [Verrucomicrobia bacterium]|nr:hypothetical protein [Verrucomicrobiota bacterium]